ncbi:hypothetical protein Q5H93_11935 [Hymenobacter sp. ASUV-10]|uniref:ArsR family transcriptional regulator n=1 Tax=Hymenobacter aranciens TaxID=3063996 RepID=A0ABT9BG01_9BACT|nr:hypothetical protein [Hymenobacter sp. ASUV-10]MDO7875443.1 hypothetical protein [Hymenobacter sp. ASUV-10]
MPTPEALVAAFEQRVLTRDEPAPILFDAASIRQRLRQALATDFGQRDPRLRKLTTICYDFLAQPAQHSTAHLPTFGCSPSALSDAWRILRDADLVAYTHDGPHRNYRLTRFGEDWLLSVVKGQPLGSPDAHEPQPKASVANEVP